MKNDADKREIEIKVMYLITIVDALKNKVVVHFHPHTQFHFLFLLFGSWIWPIKATKLLASMGSHSTKQHRPAPAAAATCLSPNPRTSHLATLKGAAAATALAPLHSRRATKQQATPARLSPLSQPTLLLLVARFDPI